MVHQNPRDGLRLRVSAGANIGDRITSYNVCYTKLLRFRTDSYVFHTTAPAPCPYLPNRLERKVVTELAQGDPVKFHEVLSRSGFRRSHAIAYAPACPGCSACVPVRIAVEHFEESRTFRKLRRANADLAVLPSLARASGEQHRLFLAYQDTRHAGGDMASMEFVITSYSIHYTKLYESKRCGVEEPCPARPMKRPKKTT